jgi:hypothetical protein
MNTFQPVNPCIPPSSRLFAITSYIIASFFIPVVVTTSTSRCSLLLLPQLGHAVASLVETPCYKPEARGFDSR